MTIREYIKSFNLQKRLRRFYQNELSEFNKLLGIKKNLDC